MSTTLTTRDRVTQIKADHARLVADGKLPADHDSVAWCVAVDAMTLAEIHEDAVRSGADKDAFLQTYLDEAAGGTPLFTPGLGAVEPVFGDVGTDDSTEDLERAVEAGEEVLGDDDTDQDD